MRRLMVPNLSSIRNKLSFYRNKYISYFKKEKKVPKPLYSPTGIYQSTWKDYSDTQNDFLDSIVYLSPKEMAHRRRYFKFMESEADWEKEKYRKTNFTSNVYGQIVMDQLAIATSWKQVFRVIWKYIKFKKYGKTV